MPLYYLAVPVIKILLPGVNIQAKNSFANIPTVINTAEKTTTACESLKDKKESCFIKPANVVNLEAKSQY